jgi:hypothetical protein
MTGTSEYNIWKNITQRSTNSNNPQADRYVNRGITVCDRWLHSFQTFLADMGSRPSDQHSIERMDNDNGYSPENCIWASRFAQAHNKGTYKNNTSGVTGVRSQRGNWVADIRLCMVCIYLGTFDTIEEAAAARQQAEAKIKWLGEDALKAMTPDRRKFIIRGW